MKKSLLFLPDISGFTNFVQTTEVAHSQHVISELLEVLLAANTQDLQLAEIEGDALFFYKEEEVPSMEKLLAQVETMFTAFYSHLKLLETNRICPCNACASAPNLQLKIIAHVGELQFITVQDKRKPFGTQVIEAHRLMKNSVESDNYVLFSKDLADTIELSADYHSKLYTFQTAQNEYDGKAIEYLFSIIDKHQLKLKPFAQAKKVELDCSPSIYQELIFPVPAPQLLEYITNYRYRHHWVEGVDRFEFNENEVTRLGSEHICVINDKHLNFITITKDGQPGQLIYGELTTEVPIMDETYQFYIISPINHDSCKLEVEVYLRARSHIKRLIINLVMKRVFGRNLEKSLHKLLEFIQSDVRSNN